MKRVWSFLQDLDDGHLETFYTRNMPKKKKLELEKLYKIQREFVEERQWDTFHTPKNIAMALGIEASELSENFLWLTDKESRKVMKNEKLAKNVRAEVADVFYWLLRLSDVLDLDLEASFLEKMQENRRKYPLHLAKGKATKYTEL